jgi:hypothetical protein
MIGIMVDAGAGALGIPRCITTTKSDSSGGTAPSELVLDIDASDIPLHGS